MWRINAQGVVSSNAGKTVLLEKCFMDEHGWVYVQTSGGFGLVHTQDVGFMAQAIEHMHWQLEDVRLDDLPQRFAYRMSPQADHRAEAT